MRPSLRVGMPFLLDGSTGCGAPDAGESRDAAAIPAVAREFLLSTISHHLFAMLIVNSQESPTLDINRQDEQSEESGVLQGLG